MYSYRGCVVIGDLVKTRRQALRLTQVQLGERAGLTQDYISKLERGSIDMPQRGTLQALGQALGISQPEFFRAAGIMDEADGEPAPARPAAIQLPLSDPDEQFDPAAIVAYVESRPGDGFQRRLRARKERMTPEGYIRFCISLFRAWSSNSHLALDAAELTEQPR